MFSCIDAHTCGNPVRVVIEGAPDLQGDDMLQKRQHFLKDYDWIRTGLMFEPRGHEAMSGSILYSSTRDDCDIAILFIEVSGCLPMCGHGTMGTVTVAIERNLVQPKAPGLLRLDTPAGVVEARYKQSGEHVNSVELTNIASYLHATDIEVNCPELGKLKLDIAYGGNFYAIIEPQNDYKDLYQLDADDIKRLSPCIRTQVNDQIEIVHPENKDIKGVSHVMWTGQARAKEATARNAVFYGDRGVDRSPCGTGTSARIAQLVSKNQLQIGDTFIHESIIGSLFTARPIKRTSVGDYTAIIPTIEGWARITGENNITLDKRDPYWSGFLLQ